MLWNKNNMEFMYGVAVDQGSGLEHAIKTLRGNASQPDDLFMFKRIITENLSKDASTLLVDAQFGRDLLPYIDASCVPMLAYEADVYRIADEQRITVLPDNLKISDYPSLGVPILKFFLYYAPNDCPTVNEKKQNLVKQIGQECKEHGVQFLFEPIVYEPTIKDETSLEYAMKKPDLVMQATECFNNPVFNIDILKVEMPVNFAYIDDLETNQQAKDAFLRSADASGNTPFVYLSAGVSFETFAHGLEFVKSQNIPFKGFMCGRAIWQDAIDVFGCQGVESAQQWVKTTGVDRLRILKDIIL